MVPTSTTYMGDFDYVARLRNKQSKERQDDREVARRRAHLEDTGFPHISSVSGMCMCLMTCCLGPGGCKCRYCPCGPEGHTDERRAELVGSKHRGTAA